MVKVIVLAVPGAGKTTILKRLSEQRKDLQIVNFGDLMFEIAAERHGLKSRDEMRTKIEVGEYRRIQELAADRIGRMSGNIIIDTHAAIKTPYGYYPGIPGIVATKINPNSIMFLEFRPEDIAARRAKDEAAKIRSRGVESIDEIEEHQRLGEVFAISAANSASCYFLNVSFRYPEAYPYQHVEDAARAIKQHVEALESLLRSHL